MSLTDGRVWGGMDVIGARRCLTRFDDQSQVHARPMRVTGEPCICLKLRCLYSEKSEVVFFRV